MMMSHLRTSATPSARPTRSSSSRDIASPIAALLCSRMPGKKLNARVVAALSISCTCANLHVHGFTCQARNQQKFMPLFMAAPAVKAASFPARSLVTPDIYLHAALHKL